MCPYKAIVECSPVSDARPVSVCICLGTLGGKWYCKEARDGGGIGP